MLRQVKISGLSLNLQDPLLRLTGIHPRQTGGTSFDRVLRFRMRERPANSNPGPVRAGGESVQLVARDEILNNQGLKTWLDLFGANEDDETNTSMIVELYELVTEHFLRISIVEGLQLLKASIPRKKQALRSKVTALSERVDTNF